MYVRDLDHEVGEVGPKQADNNAGRIKLENEVSDTKCDKQIEHPKHEAHDRNGHKDHIRLFEGPFGHEEANEAGDDRERHSEEARSPKFRARQEKERNGGNCNESAGQKKIPADEETAGILA